MTYSQEQLDKFVKALVASGKGICSKDVYDALTAQISEQPMGTLDGWLEG